ncbi:aldehyde dehydrogenase family protein [Alkalicoccus chagannorensis]|uniref:aldehyde dehydrogenase family protein n=1 Tax=Alkalicoccus chagannorensis TaxID=427072 RepID=UPI0004199D84|nr:aldehyde dehydrogenase family protein [Alkalicoccus chagannorensis]
MTDVMTHYPHVIHGEKRESEETIDVMHKFDQTVFARVGRGTESDVDAAVVSARQAFKETSWSAEDRARILRRAAELFLERKDEIARVITAEVGKVYRDAALEVQRGIDTLLVSADEAGQLTGHTIPINAKSGQENRLAFTVREPVGVIGAITPFNFPFNLTAHKLGPAIASGNAVVLKPAEKTPVTAMLMAEVLEEAGLPDGMLNVVNGYGHEVGSAMLAHDGIDMFTFTGSPDVGRRIKADSGIRKVTLELGSNAPNIVYKDAKGLQQVAEACVGKGVMHNGQACISVQRVYVHEEIYDTFAAHAKAAAENLKAGDPMDPKTSVGPMIDEASAARAESWIQEAVAAGAEIIAGGTREGALLQPTVVGRVENDMKLSCEEVFAPVIVLQTFSSIEEAVEKANDSRYGLQAGLFISDMDLAFRSARALAYGGVILNDVSTFRADMMPYGGIKDSGIGKEGPKYAMEEMTNEKVIVMNIQ